MFSLCVSLFFALCLATRASEPVVAMAPFNVRPSDLLFAINYTLATDAIVEVRVTDVVRGSAAEKIGIRKGDRLMAINGKALIGKRRRAVLGADGRIAALGRLTFEGERGLFRRPWSVTVESSVFVPPEKSLKVPEAKSEAASLREETLRP